MLDVADENRYIGFVVPKVFNVIGIHGSLESFDCVAGIDFAWTLCFGWLAGVKCAIAIARS